MSSISLATLLRWLRRGVGGALFATTLSACGTLTGDALAHVADSAGVHIVSLSPSLLLGQPNLAGALSILPSDSLVVADTSPLSLISDVELTSDGSLVLLDRLAREVRFADKYGAIVRTAKLRDDGHGAPIGIRSFGETMIVLHADSVRPLSVLPTEVSPENSAVVDPLAALAAAPIVGDWANLARGPLTLAERGQTGSGEDWTRRMASDGLSSLYLLVQDAESYTILPKNTPVPRRTVLIRFAAKQRPETLFVVPAPPSFAAPQRVVGERIRFEQAVFGARPAVAAGKGWFAFGETQIPRIRIFDSDQSLIASVRWRPVGRRLSKADVQAFVASMTTQTLKQYSGAQQTFDALSSSERRAASNTFARYRMAQRTPEYSTIFGGGDCLFIAPFAPSGNVDATGTTLIPLNVRTGRVGVSLRLHPQSRIRRATQWGVVTTERDSTHRTVVRRYVLPSAACSPSQPVP